VFSQKKFKFCVQAYSPPPLGHIASILSVWRTAPLDFELCFRGQTFAGAKLASADWGRITTLRKAV
jgi:hypothetical protein